MFAQEEMKKRPIEVNGEVVEYFPEEKKVVGSGNIVIEYEDARLTCDRVVVFMDTKDVEAVGNVVLKGLIGVLKGERINYNFGTKKGIILNSEASLGEWRAVGKEVQIKSEKEFEVKEGYITSCDLPNPHYRIRSKNITIYPDNKVVAKNVVMSVGNLPLLYLPSYNYSLKADWPSISALPGRKKDWGAFLLTNYRYNINDDNKINLRLDERENWGLAEGLDFKYLSHNFGGGLLRFYYTFQRDRARSDGSRGEEQRYRAQVRHRWDIDPSKYALLEYHELSDANFTKDFFYREEFEKDSTPESYLYLLDTQSDYSLSLLTKKRVNRFQTVTERLPEAKLDIKSQRLWDTHLYYKGDTSIANLNKKNGDSSDDSDVARFDTYNEISFAPDRIKGALNVVPFIGTRQSFYSKALNGDEDKTRGAFYTGVDLSTKLYKTHNYSGNPLGIQINRLRHILTPTLEYKYIHEPTISASELQNFDDLDTLARKNIFTFGFENKLQTKRLEKGALRNYELGYLLITGDYLYKSEKGSEFSNFYGDLEFIPYNWLRIESDTKYDPPSKDFQNWNLDIYLDKGEDLRIGFGSRYWQNSEHELTAEVIYRLNPQWAFRTFTRFDLKEVTSTGGKDINRFGEREVSITKDLHCWIGEFTFTVDRDLGTAFYFTMKLKASPKLPFAFKDYYRRPK